MLDMDPAEFRTFDPSAVQKVEQLTILGTDRFRPELLRPVREAFIGKNTPPRHRRIFISRARAARRRLLNEEEVWPLLEKAGFERVVMEDLTFQRQVELMAETAVLFAPHGAGLTNMIFCPESTHVVEIADLSFPNPNFYALASAMGHRYWLLPALGKGDAHPLERHMCIRESAVRDVLTSLG